MLHPAKTIRKYFLEIFLPPRNLINYYNNGNFLKNKIKIKCIVLNLIIVLAVIYVFQRTGDLYIHFTALFTYRGFIPTNILNLFSKILPNILGVYVRRM